MNWRKHLPCVVACMVGPWLAACPAGPERPSGGDSDVPGADAARPSPKQDAAPSAPPPPAPDAGQTPADATPPADTRPPSEPDAGGRSDAMVTVGSDAAPPSGGTVMVGPPGSGTPVSGCPLSPGTSGPALTASMGPWQVGGLGRVAATSSASALPDGVRMVGGLKGGRTFDGKYENRPDEAFFVHKQVEGDVTITAKVASLSGITGFGGAGLMIRADLNPCGLQASALTAGGGANFNCRRNTFPGSSCAVKVSTDAAVPGWLRLVRAGDQVTAHVSSNGSTWTPFGSQTIKLPRAVLVGFLITQDGTADMSITNVTITSP